MSIKIMVGKCTRTREQFIASLDRDYAQRSSFRRQTGIKPPKANFPPGTFDLPFLGSFKACNKQK